MTNEACKTIRSRCSSGDVTHSLRHRWGPRHHGWDRDSAPRPHGILVWMRASWRTARRGGRDAGAGRMTLDEYCANGLYRPRSFG